MQKDGYSLLLPSGLLEYFEIKDVQEHQGEIIIYLEEQNNINTEGTPVKLESKGFYPNVLVNDFPFGANAYY